MTTPAALADIPGGSGAPGIDDPGSVAVDPLDPDRIVAGTFDRGAWLTRDGGDSWAYIGHGVHSTHVSAVAMSPARRGERGFPFRRP